VRERPALVVGLTGGIASGKSAAATRFAERGANVVDTDLLARDVVVPDSEGLARIVDAFGTEVLTEGGELDRARLRRLVFDDAERRRRLEGILHPLIRTLMWQRVAEASGPYVVVVIPLLVEGGLHREVDRVLVIDVDSSTQRQRLAARDGSTKAQIDAILDAQATREERLRHADDVIDNTGSLEELGQQVDVHHERYLELSRQTPQGER